MRWIDNSVSQALIVAVSAAVLSALAGPAPTLAAQKSARALYEEALVADKKLASSKKLQASKDVWLKVARQYHKVVLTHPRSGYCDDALYREGELYRKAGARFRDRDAIRRALDAYLLLVDGYPTSKWSAEARLARADIYLNLRPNEKAARKEIQEILDRWPKSKEAAEARRVLARLDKPKSPPAAAKRTASGRVEVRNIRQWTGKEYTRIVIDTSDEVEFNRGRLTKPDRIYFDLFNTRLSESLASETFPVGDGFLKQIRVGQNKPDVVRVVLDFESISRYNVFSLPDPHRLVVDILGIKPETGSKPERQVATATKPPATDGVPTPQAPVASPPSADASPEPQPASADVTSPPDVVLPLPAEPTSEGRFPLSRQLGLGARRVIIDPGHGGHDPGAIGKNGLREKDLVLDISRRVAKFLEAEGNYEVILTRNTDTFIPLEERTAIANSRGADLFVSIHANSSRNRRARGLETYYLNLATSPEAEETAARENAVSTRRMTELQELLSQIMNNSKIAESREFANRVHQSMVKGVTDSGSRDLGVKTAPFYVLLGANMPSVLIEVSFLSNPDDAKRLSSGDFRHRMARSIVQGIQGYATSLKGVAHVSATTSVETSGQRR
jgi:N-acetylmuramoyl-L-alanine amidase